MAKNKDKADESEAPEEAEGSQSHMTFGEHLEELRKRIVRAMAGSIFGVTLCIIFYQVIIDIVARPFKLACEAHHVHPVMTTLKPQEAFLTSITLAFQAGLVLSSPWIIFQLWQFVAAGLYKRERKIVYRYTAPSALLFLLGVAFFYFILLPIALNFFMSFAANTAGPSPTANWLERKLGFGLPATAPATLPATTSRPAAATQPLALPVLTDDPAVPPEGQAFLFVDGRDGSVRVRTHDGMFIVMVDSQGTLFTTTWRYDDYLSFVMFTALVFGLAFELPMVIVILAQIGIVETKTFRKIRKYAYFVILVGSVIAAPSADPTTLFFLFIPLIGLYEFGIIAAAIVTRDRQKAET